MPMTAGNLKTKALTLQGQGELKHDVSMYVKDDEFTMKMGENTLLTVGLEGDEFGEELNNSQNTTLFFQKPVVFESPVSIGNLKFKPSDNVLTVN